jgi:hypothetical protein
LLHRSSPTYKLRESVAIFAPVGKAQEKVLEALGMTATGFADANRQFEKIGIVVSSRRDGRVSVPVVTVKDRFDGGFNAGGDGDCYRKYDDIDLSAVEQWIAKES